MVRRRLKKTIMTGLMTAALALAGAPDASADTPFPGYGDPHIPDYGRGWCPGSASSFATSCDGVPYDDGSFWRQSPQYFSYADPASGGTIATTCRIHNGSGWAPEDPDGCQ
jgi:hypothetical protein